MRKITPGAIFSECRAYRYRLDRYFGNNGPTIAFGLHNPSTANENTDDPTLRRGICFAKDWGAGKLVFVNPFAACATRPKDLWLRNDPIGPRNDFYIRQVAKEVERTGGFFVFAWGAISPPAHLRKFADDRLIAFSRLVRDQGCETKCLGFTLKGYPRHPLYLPANEPLRPY